MTWYDVCRGCVGWVAHPVPRRVLLMLMMMLMLHEIEVGSPCNQEISAKGNQRFTEVAALGGGW